MTVTEHVKMSERWWGSECVREVIITWCREGGGEGVGMQRGAGFTCSASLVCVGVEDEWGGEICAHTFPSIISFMSSRCIPILKMSPSTSLHTFQHTWRCVSGCINPPLTHSHRYKSTFTCSGRRCRCSWTGPCSSASPELGAPPSYWCIFFPAGPEPPSCSSASTNGHILHYAHAEEKRRKYTALKNDIIQNTSPSAVQPCSLTCCRHSIWILPPEQKERVHTFFSNFGHVVMTHLHTYRLHELADDVSQLSSHSFTITGSLVRQAGRRCVHLFSVALRGRLYFFTAVFWKDKARASDTHTFTFDT